jgi:CheY-like chemotaxis protein/anti-sigma regulatory factor (Ser/Thr protein kinase)
MADAAASKLPAELNPDASQGAVSSVAPYAWARLRSVTVDGPQPVRLRGRHARPCLKPDGMMTMLVESAWRDIGLREKDMPTVMVVDDSAVDRRIVRGLLERAGDFDVIDAADGEDALEKVQQRVPDVIVTDLQMPRLDGFELVDALKEDYPSVPVVLITAKGSEDIAARALQRGAASYVPKACLASDLVPTVSRVLTATREDRLHTRLMNHMNRCDLGFTLVNDLPLIQSAVSLFQQMLRCLPLADEIERLRVGIAIEEALKNAYYHGNLEIGSIRPRPKREEYSRIAAERVYATPYRNRRIHVRAEISRERALFIIRDEGPGFDFSRLPTAGALADHDESTSRGVSLMRTIMDEVSYHDTGNEVSLVKYAVRHEPGDESEETAGHALGLGDE